LRRWRSRPPRTSPRESGERARKAPQLTTLDAAAQQTPAGGLDSLRTPMQDRRPRRIAALPAPTPLPAGLRVGRCEVRQVLGTGSTGIVYRAFDPATDEDLALREYLPAALAVRSGPDGVRARSPDLAEAFDEGRRLFVEEALALARLDHPGVVKVHDAWEENGTAYVRMELVTGRDLAVMQQLRARPPREETLRQLLAVLIDAVDELHRAGLQHGAITPHDILVEPNGRTVLLDLGRARQVLRAVPSVPAGATREGYLAPEMDAESKAARGPWSDIYSLGAVLHFIISGRPPPPAAARNADEGVAARLRKADPRYSGAFLRVVERMLAPDPAQRPRDIDALRAALGDSGRTKLRGDASEAATKKPRRWRRLAWWGIGFAVLLAAAATTVWFLHRSGRLPPLPALPWLRR